MTNEKMRILTMLSEGKISPEEAEKLLKGMKRTTRLNLVICDREHGGVLEITPNNVVLRRSTDGICACTNHFRTGPMTGADWGRVLLAAVIPFVLVEVWKVVSARRN